MQDPRAIAAERANRIEAARRFIAQKVAEALQPSVLAQALAGVGRDALATVLPAARQPHPAREGWGGIKVNPLTAPVLAA